MPADLARYQAVFPERAQRPLWDTTLFAQRFETFHTLFHAHMEPDFYACVPGNNSGLNSARPETTSKRQRAGNANCQPSMASVSNTAAPGTD